ncbi:helix-turn-helix transcriptional regulator [Alphaproteobacteria bacterium KMM 3653]|uniref:Helix-turn-helix transcriptional regulator n=1 Tax=Harenicola maris TaxID=2841044 RepID=A0AAP2G7W7_9RHOB|nr:helix-turn-helix transcriptional regulator [Harenicola maris]
MTETPHSMLRIARRDGTTDAPPEALDLGARVRSLRQAQGWTLAQAAERAGLARSTLSKIENGQMSPTFAAVRKLAHGLDIPIPQLFRPTNSRSGAARLDITPNGEGQGLVTTTYEHRLLSQGFPGKQMLPYQARIRARSMDDFDGWIRHAGEEFLYVLTGIVRLYTEGFEPQDLRRGDSAYYDAAMGHNVISLSQEDATLLWVTTQD